MIIVYLIGKAMNNKTKAAIEEAAKLPTAEEVLRKFCGENILNGGFYAGPKFALQAIESHTQAHTEGLRERVKELEELMQEFVDRVDRGEVRSKKTYAKFKEALK